MRLYTSTALALVASAMAANPAAADTTSSAQSLSSPIATNLQATNLGTPGFHYVPPAPVLIDDWQKGAAARAFKRNVVTFRSVKSGGNISSGTTTVMATTLSAGTNAPEVPADIAVLARALKNDPDLIYQFVRDNIELYPIFGVHKGAVGALIDRQGTDADQALLMADLLRSSGYQASVVKGLVVLTKAQIQSFYGVPTTSDCALQNLFASGRIPVDRFLCSAPDTSLGFYHFWVRATINGQNYDFDPSFKAHTVKTPIDLKTAVGYNATTYMNNARTGATVTSDSITNLNRANVRSQLTTYANNLVSYIRANSPAASLDDIIGGKSITPPATRNEGPLRQSRLPYEANSPEEIFAGDIPVNYRNVLEISTGGSTIDLLADSFYGTRLTISPDANNNLQLLSNGQLVTTFNQLQPGVTQDMTVTIYHNAYQDRGVDASFVKKITGGETLAFTLGFGEATRALGKVYRNQIADAHEAGASDSSEAVTGGGLSAIGADVQAQLGLTMELTGRQAGVTDLFHHFIGIVSEHDGGPLVDLKALYLSTVQQDNNTAVGTAAFISDTLHGSSFESGVLEQTFNDGAASTIRILDDAIATGVTIYDGNSSNWASDVQPNLVNCSASDLSDMANYANSYRVIVPQNCADVVEQWKGLGYLVINPNPGNLFASALIDGAYFGGYLGNRRNLTADDFRNKNSLLDRNQHDRGDPIDMATGNFTYSHEDVSVGERASPRSLSMQKIYNSAARKIDGPFGRGWSHNLAMRVQTTSDALQGLGEDSSIDAATSIAETMVALDLMSDQSLPLDKMATAVVGQRWFAEQFENNAVNANVDVGGNTFVKLPDGTYNPSPGNSSKLIKNADGTYTESLVDKTTYQFDSSGNIVARKEPNGFEVHFGYTNGQLTSVQNSLGRSLAFTYSGSHVSAIQDGTGRSVGYGYDTNGNLTSFTDANGKLTTFEYDQPGRMTKFYLPTNPTSPQVVNTFDSLGRIAQQTDADGKVWNVYVAGTRSELVSPVGHRVADYFAPNGSVIATLADFDTIGESKGSWQPRQTLFWYDGLGRLIKRMDSRDPMIQLTYDDASCNSAEKRCTNNVLTRRQTAIHNTGDTPTNPDILTSFTYEGQFNKVATSTSGLGKVTNYSYDPATGNLLTMTLPPAVDGGTLRPQTSYGYTSFAGVAGYPTFTLRTSIMKNIDASTSVTHQATYDTANFYVPKTSIVDSGGLNLTTTYGYDNIGNLISVDGPRTDVADVTSYSYDPERRLLSTTNALSKSSVINQNADGDITSVASQIGSQWMATCYTRLVSGKVTRVTGPAIVSTSTDCPAAVSPTAVTDIGYDDDGHILTSTINLASLEGGSRVTQFENSPSGAPFAVARAVGTALEQADRTAIYYSNGGPTSPMTELRFQSANHTDPGFQSQWKFTLEDGHGRLNNNCGVSAGANSCDVYNHDADNNLTSWGRPGNQVFTIAYDNDDHATQMTAPSRTNTVAYTYDLLGRVLTAKYTGSGETVSFAYDKADRILSTTASGRTIAYQYDAAGNRTRVTWPDTAFYVTYDYDALGRVSAIKEKGATLLASFGYDDLSHRTAVTYGNGTSITYGYDNQGRLSSLTDDLAGTAADLTRSFGRDQAGEITSVQSSNGVYDWNGYYNINRPYTNDSEDTYLTSGTKSLTYDVGANLSGDGTWTFTYDAQNRLLTAVVKNGASLTYAYDPLSRLEQRKSGTKSIVNYMYDGDQLLGEYSSTGALLRRYVRGPGTDEPLVIYDGTNAGTKTWLYADERGSITATADASGNSTSTLSYGPFGEPNVTTGVSLRYTGQMLDPESGLYYYKARWYSPYLGRFMSRDPAWFVDGLHLYRYVANDPVDHVDPSGLSKQLSPCNGPASDHPLLDALGTAGDVADAAGTYISAEAPEVGIPLKVGGAAVSYGVAGYEWIEAGDNAFNQNYADLTNLAFGAAEGKFLGRAFKNFWPLSSAQLRNRLGHYTNKFQNEAGEPIGQTIGEKIGGHVCQ